MSDPESESRDAESAPKSTEFKRKGFTFLGLGLQDVIRYFFGGNASLAIILLVLICVFLAKEAVMFFPDHHRGLKAYRHSGQEFVDYVGAEIDAHTRIYSSANIAYYAEVNRTSVQEDSILRTYRTVLANVEQITGKTWDQFELVLEDIEDTQDNLEGLREEDEPNAAEIAELTARLEKAKPKADSLRTKLEKEVQTALGMEEAWDLGAAAIEPPREAREKLREAIVFEASPEAEDEHPYIEAMKAKSREKKSIEAENYAEFKDVLKELQAAIRPMKSFHRDLKEIAEENRKKIQSFDTAPARRDALLKGAEVATDPEEKARMKARAEAVVIVEPDYEALTAPIVATIDQHRELLAPLQSEVERLYKALPDEVETAGAEENLEKADDYYKSFVNTVQENRAKIQDWSYDRPVSAATSVSAFLFGRDWITNSSWHDFYGLLPLFTGSLMISIIALIVAVPFSVAAAIYVNQLAGFREQNMIKPTIEFIGAIPSVVLGFFGILVFGETLRALSQWELLAWVPGFPMAERLTILNAGLLLAFMAVPTIFTLTEDALNNVPKALTENSLAMGATKLQTIFRVIVPTAVSGILAAILLGFGRIIGETMVVLLVAGNKIKIPDFTEGIGVIAQPAHTMTGIIAQELGEVDSGSLHWRALFMVGMILFVISLCVNFAAQRILKKLQKI